MNVGSFFTTPQLLDQLNDAEILSNIEVADLITISIGANDALGNLDATLITNFGFGKLADIESTILSHLTAKN